MKRLNWLLLGLFVLVLPAASMAQSSIAGSAHDLTGSGEQLCFACHVPHNALGDKLWARNPSGTFTGVQDLCYTCHDGSVTGIGSGTAFNAATEQHINVNAADCSGDGACHDVHNQNPNGTGRFTVSGVTLTNGTYCETCHDADQPTGFESAAALGDHTAGLTHFTNGGTFTCNQCHTIHGGTPQTTNPVGLSNPILLADNEPGAYYGAFCISCHNGSAPAEAAVGTGGQAATDVFDYSEASNDGSETKHPTISTTGTTPTEGCDKCHDVHDPSYAGTATYLLMADNTDSGYCLSCHSAAGAPAIGANTHYTGLPSDVSMNTTAGPTLPWSDQIDDDGVVGADYTSATANNLVCETCHSVHRNGFTGVGEGYFLRDANGAQNELCQRCHDN